MSTLLDKVRVEVDGKVDGLQKALASGGKTVDDFASRLGKLSGGAGGIDSALGALGTRVGGLASAFSSAGGAAGVLGAALVGVGVESARMAQAVETNLLRVRTALGLVGQDAQELRDNVSAFSIEFGRTQSDIAALMKSVADNGPGGAAGLREVTRAALELAALTGDDPTSLASGLDGVIDAFGRSSEEARTLAASLFGITKGKIPLTDLFDTLDKVAASARASGLSLEEVVAAATAMRDANVPVRLIKTELIALGEAGAAGAARIRDLAGATRDGSQEWLDYSRALDDAAKQSDRVAASIRSQLSDEMTRLGTNVLPIVNAALGHVNSNLERLRSASGLQVLATAISGGKIPLPDVKRDPVKDVRFFTPDKDRVGQTTERVATDRIEAIRRATAEIGKLTTAQVRGYIAELGRLATSADLGVIAKNHAAALSAELERGLDKAGTVIETKAKALAERVAAANAQVAARLAQSTGDQIAIVQQQIRQLDADAAKFGTTAAARAKSGFNEQNFRALRQALEDQVQLLEVAQAAAEFEQRTAKDRAAAQEHANDTAEAALRLARQAREELQTLNDPRFGLPGPTDEQLTALASYKAVLDDIATSALVSAEHQHRAAEEAQRIGAAIKAVVGGDGASSGVKEAKDHAGEFADNLARGARAMLDAATAAGLLDSNLANALTSAVNLADNVAKIIATKGQDAGSIVGALTAAVALGKQLLGQSDAEKRRSVTDEANRRAIEGLTRALGDLAGLTVGGGTFARVRSAVGSAVAGFNSFGAGVSVGDATRFRNADAFFRAAGVSPSDLEAVAKALGVTLDGTAGSFRRLDEALKAADMQAFVNSWAGALEQLDLLLSVDKVTDPTQRLVEFGKRASAANSAVLTAILNGRDLSTTSGRAEARAGARQLLDDFIAGRVDLGALGDLSPQQFLEFVRRFIGGIDEVEQALADAAAKAAADAATLEQANAETARRQAEEFARSVAEAARDAAQALETARSKLVTDTLAGARARSAIRDADAVGELQDLAAALAKLSPAMAGLVEGLDLTSAEGVAALDRRIRDLFDGIEGGTVALNLGTLSLDEFRDALLNLEAQGDSAAESIRSAAAALADAAHAAVQTRLELLRNRNGPLAIPGGLGLDQALALGRNDPLLAHILDGVFDAPGLQRAWEKFLRDDLDPARLGQATPEELRRLQDVFTGLQQLLGFVPSSNIAIPSDVAPTAIEIASSVHALDRDTGVTIADALRSMLVIQGTTLPRIADSVEALLAVVGGPLATLSPPELPGGFAGAGGVDNSVHVVIEQLVVGAGADAAAAQGVGEQITSVVRSGLAGANANGALGGAYRFTARVRGERTVRGGVG